MAAGLETDATLRTGQTSCGSSLGAGPAAKEREQEEEDFRSWRRNVRWCVFFFVLASTIGLFFCYGDFGPRASFRCSPLRVQRPLLSVCIDWGQGASDERTNWCGRRPKTTSMLRFFLSFRLHLDERSPTRRKQKGGGEREGKKKSINSTFVFALAPASDGAWRHLAPLLAATRQASRSSSSRRNVGRAGRR